MKCRIFAFFTLLSLFLLGVILLQLSDDINSYLESLNFDWLPIKIYSMVDSLERKLHMRFAIIELNFDSPLNALQTIFRIFFGTFIIYELIYSSMKCKSYKNSLNKQINMFWVRI